MTDATLQGASPPRRILDDIAKCVRCGSCKAHCPTYTLRGIEPMSARGRVVLVGALIDGAVPATPLLASRLTSCLLCGMCEGSCPVGVGITDVVYHGLDMIVGQDRGRQALRRLMGFALKRPLLCFKAARLASPVLDFVTSKLDLPFDIKLPPEPLSVGLEIFKPVKPIGRVAVFTGCDINYHRPELGRILIRALFHMGYEVVFPAGEVCCGAPLRALGMEREATEMAMRNLEVFGKLNAEAVLSLCPTCTLALSRQYPALVGTGMDNAMDATAFLAPRLEGAGIGAASGLDEGGSMVYHAPCHLKYGLGQGRLPVDMLSSLGLRVEVPASHNCCGFSQSMADRGISEDLLAGLSAEYGGYDTVVTACPGCMEQIGRGHSRVIHAIEALSVPEPE